MSELFIQTKECDGECGTKIELTVRSKNQRGCKVEDLMGVAELLGWKSVDVGKKHVKTLLFCEYCQDRARLIVEGQ